MSSKRMSETGISYLPSFLFKSLYSSCICHSSNLHVILVCLFTKRLLISPRHNMRLKDIKRLLKDALSLLIFNNERASEYNKVSAGQGNWPVMPSRRPFIY